MHAVLKGKKTNYALLYYFDSDLMFNDKNFCVFNTKHTKLRSAKLL